MKHFTSILHYYAYKAINKKAIIIVHWQRNKFISIVGIFSNFLILLLKQQNERTTDVVANYFKFKFNYYWTDGLYTHTVNFRRTVPISRLLSARFKALKLPSIHMFLCRTKKNLTQKWTHEDTAVERLCLLANVDDYYTKH